jgi:hypothetical protein
MKKSLFISFLLTTYMSVFSQTFLLQEYFNDPVNLPTTWTTIDKDGDTYNWCINTSGTETYAVSESYRAGETGALNPVNYLISPKIDLTGLTGNVKLRYTIQVADPDYFTEHYKVAVSTTGKAAADFTNIVKEETCTAEDYLEVFPYWHERIVDLTPFLGKNIYLTWCHYNCSNLYKFQLDSIQVSITTNVGLLNSDKARVAVYPNPAKEKLIITGLTGIVQLQLVTADGQLVYQSAKETFQASIDVSPFENGLYFLRIKSQKGIITEEVSILH